LKQPVYHPSKIVLSDCSPVKVQILLNPPFSKEEAEIKAERINYSLPLKKEDQGKEFRNTSFGQILLGPPFPKEEGKTMRPINYSPISRRKVRGRIYYTSFRQILLNPPFSKEEVIRDRGHQLLPPLKK